MWNQPIAGRVSDVNIHQSTTAVKPTQFISNARKHTWLPAMSKLERESSLERTIREEISVMGMK